MNINKKVHSSLTVDGIIYYGCSIRAFKRHKVSSFRYHKQSLSINTIRRITRIAKFWYDTDIALYS